MRQIHNKSKQVEFWPRLLNEITTVRDDSCPSEMSAVLQLMYAGWGGRVCSWSPLVMGGDCTVEGGHSDSDRCGRLMLRIVNSCLQLSPGSGFGVSRDHRKLADLDFADL